MAYVMTFCTELAEYGRPVSFYLWNTEGNDTPPWGYKGYSLMEARSLDQAVAEFEAAYEAWWAEQE